jgi:hypothetical protein
MQICRLIWEKNGAKKARADSPFGIQSRNELATLLLLIKNARKYKERVGLKMDMPDRVLVVQPRGQAPFEIPYSSGFDEPLDDVYSFALKEALYALSGGANYISVIHLENQAVKRVIQTGTVAPHRGGSYTPTLSAELHLTPERGLTLFLKLTAAGTVVLQKEKNVSYGRATVFSTTGGSTYVVLLNPSDAHKSELR